jgi:hypothetical protein
VSKVGSGGVASKTGASCIKVYEPILTAPSLTALSLEFDSLRVFSSLFSSTFSSLAASDPIYWAMRWF